MKNMKLLKEKELMKNILTAINNEKLVKKILKNNITENKNILYKEAIIETIKKNKNINIIIIRKHSWRN